MVAKPREFTDTIRQIFGAEGEAWLRRVDRLFNQCVEKWQLSQCELAHNLSINLIVFAKSPDYGDVVLKLGVPHHEFFTEITALALYDGQSVCACYDADIELGAMLLERVMPGHNLRALPHADALKIGVDVISRLPMPVQGSPDLPYFSDWMDRAFARVRRERKVNDKMLFYVAQAERLFHEIQAVEPAIVLLHGDLHHENILRDQAGSWKVIDPKGVLGFPCLESGRFIQNHLDGFDDNTRCVMLQELATAFGAAFDRPERTIAICAFIDCVLSRCWTFEEYLSPAAFATEMAEALGSSALYFDFIQDRSPYP